MTRNWSELNQRIGFKYVVGAYASAAAIRQGECLRRRRIPDERGMRRWDELHPLYLCSDVEICRTGKHLKNKEKRNQYWLQLSVTHPVPRSLLGKVKPIKI